MKNSAIAWTDHTFNAWMGCQKVSPGCDHCYAEAGADLRYHLVQWGPHGERRRMSEDYWRNPYRWIKAANGERQRVFCASWADVFDNKAPPGERDRLWRLITATPQLDWMLLTKRPQNIAKMLPTNWGNGWRNVWLGTTCESQEYYDQRWPILSAIPAVVHFISYEPALGPLRIAGKMLPDWVICGGESGRQARFMEPTWARALRDQCADRGVAFFMKQMTRKAPIPPDLLVRQFPLAQTTKGNAPLKRAGG